VLIRQLLDFEGIPQEIIRAFNDFDRDGNGRISAYEVRRALHIHFGIQVSDLQVGAHCRSVSLRVAQCR
jgi:Ca2+-binding EF-hand superfamily protein